MLTYNKSKVSVSDYYEGATENREVPVLTGLMLCREICALSDGDEHYGGKQGREGRRGCYSVNSNR